METPLTKLLGCRYPVIQTAMGCWPCQRYLQSGRLWLSGWGSNDSRGS